MFDFAANVFAAEEGKTHLFSVGQAGYILKSKSGRLMGVDLYLSDCVERLEGHMGFKRLLPRLLDPMELVFDCIAASHPHRDHFDFDSIPQLLANPKTHLFASIHCMQEIKKLPVSDKQVSYVQPGDNRKNTDFEICFVSCDHGQAAPDAVGLIITVDGKKIYMAGDTCLRLDRMEEYAAKGPFDVLIAPVNGAYGNMDERDCAQLSAILQPKITIPCHYGMFASHGGNPGLFIENMKALCPLNHYLLMAQGECITL